MTYISVTLCADLRAGSVAVWHGAGAVQPEGDMTPADLARFNIIRIMRTAYGRVPPVFAQEKRKGHGGGVSKNHRGHPPPPAEMPAALSCDITGLKITHIQRGAPPVQNASNVLLAHIEALYAQLEEAEDEEQALEVTLILLDLYERILEEHEVLIIDRGETMH